MHRSLLASRIAAGVTLLVQLALHSGLSWRDARAEGESVRQRTHVEALGARHAQPAHAPDCAVSQHLQSPSAPASRLHEPAPPHLAAALPPRSAAGTLSVLAGGISSRGPPAAA